MEIKQATKELINVIKKPEHKRKALKPYAVISARKFMKKRFPNVPLIEGLLSKGELAILSGASGIGKSFLLLFMSIALATGKDFLGFKCQRKAVLYLDRENRDVSRQKRLKLISKTTPTNLYFSDIEDERLDCHENVKRLILTCKKNKIALIVFDTMNRFFDFDENSAEETNNLYLNVLKPIRDKGISVFIIHHESKKGQMRGSTDLGGMTDNTLSMKRDKRRNMQHVFWLNIDKARDRAKESIAFTLNISDNSASLEVLKNITAEQVKGKVDDMANEIYSILKKKPLERKEIAKKLKVDNRKNSCLTRAIALLRENGKIIKVLNKFQIKKDKTLT